MRVEPDQVVLGVPDELAVADTIDEDRFWLTARGYRALGRWVPDDVDDDEPLLVLPLEAR